MKRAKSTYQLSVEPPAVRVDGDRMSVRFDRFDRPAYDLFLRVKRLPEYTLDFDDEACAYTVSAPSRFAGMLGVPVPPVDRGDLPYADFLFDDQRAIVEMALNAKRFADWKDTGLGKTVDFLEWARHVIHRTGGGRVLIITLANLVPQTLEMAGEFYGDRLPIVRLDSRVAMREWCGAGTLRGEPTGAKLAIVNYEKFNPEKGKTGREAEIPEVRQLAGVVLDESSRLAMGGGKQKWVIIHSTKGVPYKLSCTATPAPNDTMEFASQASFLERMRSEGEIIWTYFTRHPKTHRWQVKRHARKAFFEFMSSWSIYVRDPRAYGWRVGMKDLPPPEVIRHTLKATPEQLRIAGELTTEPSGQQQLFVHRDTNTVERAKLSQVAKGFRYVTVGKSRRVDRVPSPKPAFIADLIRAEVDAGHQVLVWTVFDAESDLIAEALDAQPRPGVPYRLLTGSVAKHKRGEILERFRRGDARVLISRASMLGFGMNFQHCSSMVFSGWSDSYVAWYQAIRRAYRYGQTKTVRVHVPVIPELEGQMLDNIAGKQSRHEADIREMEANYLAARAELSAMGEAARKGAA